MAVVSTRCWCPCHSTRRADLASQGAYLKWQDTPDDAYAKQPSPLVTDAIAAATACPSCLALHAPALLNIQPPRKSLPKPNTPWIDGEGD